jgi:DNA-directed RNA polymerase subunit K/omega
MIQRPLGLNAFEFAVVSGLRAAQLRRGCLPRIERGHKNTVTAQLEVAAGKVRRDISSILARVD